MPSTRQIDPVHGERGNGGRVTPLGWVGLGWVGLGWVGLGWVGLGWVGLGWVGLGWVGLGWVGLGWVGLLGWVGDCNGGFRVRSPNLARSLDPAVYLDNQQASVGPFRNCAVPYRKLLPHQT